MMKDYVILNSTCPDRLEKSVIEVMLKGYLPIGGLSVTCDPLGRYCYFQAVIRKEIVE